MERVRKRYKVAPFVSHYGGIEQRWLIVYSEQAYKREQKTLEKRLKGKDDAIKMALWHLGNEVFDCEKDALAALKKIERKNRLYVISSRVIG